MPWLLTLLRELPTGRVDGGDGGKAGAANEAPPSPVGVQGIMPCPAGGGVALVHDFCNY